MPANQKSVAAGEAKINEIAVKAPSIEEMAVAVATLPTVQAAFTVKEFSKSCGDLDMPSLVASLKEETEAVSGGDLGRIEATLTAQARTLDAIFNNLARRAAHNMSDNLPACEAYLKLALRAQAQCRSTLEALANIKQPKAIAFVGQANIAHGHQQVNNST